MNYNYIVRQTNGAAELYIDLGKESEEQNKAIFDELQQKRPEIDLAFGAPLEWDQVEGRRACRVRWTGHRGGYRDEDVWPAIHEEMIDAMVRLEAALRPHIRALVA